MRYSRPISYASLILTLLLAYTGTVVLSLSQDWNLFLAIGLASSLILTGIASGGWLSDLGIRS
ncbi:MAG: hypothetical protein SNJ70_08780, partial [Armatimonadota bacterium]